MKDHGCMSCHHVPLLLWSHRSAQAQGFKVDSQKLAKWDQWTRKDSLANRNLFTLRPYDLGRPEAATLPLAVKDKLKPLIARPFQTKTEFLAELTKLLTEDEMKSHRATVLKISERPVDIFDRVGGGLESLGPLLIASQGTASVLARSEFRDGVIDLMSQIQLADGSWTPAGRSGRRDAPLDASDGESSDHDVDDARTCLLRHTGSEAICVDSESPCLSTATDAESR